MRLALDIFTMLFVAAGLLFFIAGTVGLLRLPDPISRLHALTKADNIGLGLLVIGLLPQAVRIGGAFDAAKMLGIWLLVQLSSGALSQLMADVALRQAEEAAPLGETPAPEDATP